MSNETNTNASKGIRLRVQRLGRLLSGMVMPNIGAFIAWGLITALFIPTGWFPNENLGALVDPMIKYLLPLLIGYTGGQMIHGKRGAVIGAVTTVGVIVGAEIPMFLGAMIVGPLAAWVLKQFDKLIEGKIKSGFEMLVNNFSLGIIGGALTLVAYTGIGPLVQGITQALSAGVDVLVNANLRRWSTLSLSLQKYCSLTMRSTTDLQSDRYRGVGTDRSIGSVYAGIQSGSGTGHSSRLLVLRTRICQVFRTGAVVIHFLGGIHEIYFPYILMKPVLILVAIAGGVAGTFTFQILGAGLVGPASPGASLLTSPWPLKAA